MQKLCQQTGNLNNFQYVDVNNVLTQVPQAGNQEEQLDRNNTYTLGNTNRRSRSTKSRDQNPTPQKSGIIAMKPNSFNVIKVNVEVIGGMEGGSQEEPTNLHERGTKGGKLPHVMHEGLNNDHKTDFRALDNTKDKNTQEDPQMKIQKVQSAKNRKQKIENNKEKPQDRKEEGGMH